MMVIEFTEDKIGKAMKAISKIGEHVECLSELFEDSESRYGNRRRYDDDEDYRYRYGRRI